MRPRLPVARLPLWLGIVVVGGLRSAVRCQRQDAVLRDPVRARQRDGGHVVNVSTSYTPGHTDPGLIPYAMTRAAIDTFIRTLAKELGPRAIKRHKSPGPRGRR